jgi:tRNA(fMet)-specific endonuclease VapC
MLRTSVAAGATGVTLTVRMPVMARGKSIGNMDLLIAAHAVSQHMTVVTNNIKHFSSVPGLEVELWC